MFHFNQNREWQLNKVLATADCMIALGYWLVSEVIITIKGEKADSNLEQAFKDMGVMPDKAYTIGNKKGIAGDTILSRAAKVDAQTKKGSCASIADGHHKAAAVFLATEFGGVTLTPIVVAVDAELAKRIAVEANLAETTSASLGNDDKLKGVVNLRAMGIYKAQKDLPFGSNDRGNHQNYWWRSEAVIVKGYALDKVAKLGWQTCKQLVEGVPYEDAIAAAAEKKHATKIITAETVKMGAKMATNADPVGTDTLTAILKAAAEGENDTFKRLVAEHYSKRSA